LSEPSFRSVQAELDWSAEGLPVSTRFSDVYYAREDALGESNHVFIEGSKLPQRWSGSPPDNTSNHCFVIAETGFGAALNFLLCWRLWREHSQKHTGWNRLHYLAMEQYPVSTGDLSKLHSLWPDLANYSATLRQWYRPDCSGWQRMLLSPNVCLDLYIGNATAELEKRSTSDQPVDAWLLDGFTPDKNPDLWSDKLFQLMAKHSHAASSVATYSCAGHVRRGLQQAGFEVGKAPGFANKRHMLCGDRFDPHKTVSATEPFTAPWFRIPRAKPKNRQAIIVGAGLAGCTTAWSLASRGWRVRVLEAGDTIGAGASGIPQLALRCRLFSQADWPAHFYLQAYGFACRFFRSIQLGGDSGWHETGVMQLSNAINKRKSLQASTVASLYPASIVQVDTGPESLQKFAADGAYWFAEGGWVDPVVLCNRLLSAKDIEVRCGQSVQKLQHDGEQWRLLGEQEEELDAAAVVILACGPQVANFHQTEALEYELTSGQCSVLQSNTALAALDSVLGGARTVFPAANGSHTVAATYRPAARLPVADADSDQENLTALAELLGVTTEDFTQCNSAVGLRANTRDRIPTIGQVPDFDIMKNQYAGLSQNANRQFDQHGHYHRGLYLSSGHGSNGLSTCPLAGEILASLINGDCLPVGQEIMSILNPSRFLIQDLKKQRV
jgi:tRNA 5-methylaminomethyl-2-thiouridine biosynthesis bifunctional protein